MKEVKKEEIKKVLEDGAIVFLKGSITGDERLYRLSNNKIEYSDNNKDWKLSNITLDEMETREWTVLKK